MSDELMAFAVLGRPQAMRDWLEVQRATAFKTLATDRDPVGLHQAQGKVQLLDRMLALLDKSQTTR